MIADVSQSIRQIIRVAMGMPANSVVPADQLAGAGTEVQHLATVNVIDASDVGWPAITRENVTPTPPSTTVVAVTENVDQLKEIVASVNFYRGGNADAAGLAQWTLKAVDDAARIAQRLRMAANAALILSLGLTFVKGTAPRNLTALVGSRWKSRGSVDLTFYVVNREQSQINSVGSGSFTTKIGSASHTTEVTT